MTKGFVDNNQALHAIYFYQKMVGSNSKPNKYTYPPLLKACGIVGVVEEGVQVHTHVVKHGLRGDGHIRSAGIRMYVSFGRILEARKVFDERAESDVVRWNAMMVGYRKGGDVDAAREMLEAMTEKNTVTWNGMVSGLLGWG
ncbi:Pentatricopeptide repeat-containing protein [Actinidia chinensis var. chinensis]|uniref:Pentatricopeptide repeat-containing protein n=1 Tax=Actinidia chinensis var. chinensis TaxID=1590841 RepID=A0A2R6Q774_ACTCC|nr:Pentatricopeptide repeat-containing protein [Actinidia chinensis var. chinensis]